MGIEGTLGRRKHRAAEAAVGEPLHRANAWSPDLVECITPDDRHAYWWRREGRVEWLPSDVQRHFTSCPTVDNQPPPWSDA